MNVRTVAVHAGSRIGCAGLGCAQFKKIILPLYRTSEYSEPARTAS